LDNVVERLNIIMTCHFSGFAAGINLFTNEEVTVK